VDIKSKVNQKGGQGNAAAEYSDFVARSGSWAYGRDARYNAITAESREEDLAWGVPNTNEDSTSNDFQYGLRGPEQHAIKTVTDTDSSGAKRGE
jgi:hypothetical protein